MNRLLARKFSFLASLPFADGDPHHPYADSLSSNLTGANHVIFVSPLLTVNKYKYDSSMTQAIGRIRRYGQNKKCYIHRFFTLETVDVDIIQKREKLLLTKTEKPGKYKLLPPPPKEDDGTQEMFRLSIR